MVNNTVHEFVGSKLGVEIFIKPRKHHKKGELKVWGWSFKKIPFALYTYVLTKILQNGAKFIQKLTPGFKSRTRNLDNFRQAMETPKS